MAQIETAKLTLTSETREFLEHGVASGAYASEGEIITEALENMRADAQMRQEWEEVIKVRYNEWKANPGDVVPFEDVVRRMHERRQQRAVLR